MAHKIAFDEAVNCYFVQWRGMVDVDELREFYHNFARLPWFRSGLSCLADMRQANFRTSPTGTYLITDLQKLAGSMFGAGRVAAVVDDHQTHEFVQTVNLLTSGPERPREIFSDYEAAKAWLGLPADYVGPLDGSE